MPNETEKTEPLSTVLDIEDLQVAAEEIRALRRRVRELEDWSRDHDKWGHSEAIRLEQMIARLRAEIGK